MGHRGELSKVAAIVGTGEEGEWLTRTERLQAKAERIERAKAERIFLFAGGEPTANAEERNRPTRDVVRYLQNRNNLHRSPLLRLELPDKRGIRTLVERAETAELLRLVFEARLSTCLNT